MRERESARGCVSLAVDWCGVGQERPAKRRVCLFLCIPPSIFVPVCLLKDILPLSSDVNGLDDAAVFVGRVLRGAICSRAFQSLHMRHRIETLSHINFGHYI